MNADPSKNSESYREQQKEATYKKIEDAIIYLRNSHLEVTKARIAEETGLHPNTLSRPHVKSFLSKFPEFSTSTTTLPPTVDDCQKVIQSLQAQNQSLKNRLAVSQSKNHRIEEKLRDIREKYKKLEDDYEYLLGDYQLQVQKKTIRF